MHFTAHKQQNLTHTDMQPICPAMPPAKEQNITLEDRLARTVPLDVTTHALGLEVFGGAFHIIVPKNSSLPLRKSATFTTAGDYQTGAQIKLYEGESMMCRTNKQLAKVGVGGRW